MTDSRRNSPRASVSQRRVSITWGQWILGGPSWLLFVVGCCIGHFHGRFFGSDGAGVVHLQQQQLLHTDESSSSSSRGLQQIRSSAQPQNNNNCLTDGDGWHTIHVFYGKTDHLDDDDDDSRELPPPPQPSSTATTSISSASVVADNVQQSRHLQQPQPEKRRRWYSQARQDELVIALLRNKTDGYFIDLAANDATQLSNTYALEKYYGWNGICIEPNPTYWHNLTYRKCMMIGAVVGAERMQEVYFRFEAGDHGGIADEGFDNGKRWQRSSERRYTVPLLEILRDRARAPVTIDYLSLDVEGAETFIMQNFPLDQYRIKLITAERLKGDIRGYLKSHGYQFVQRLSKWGESLWVHDSVRDELDWSVIERFNFPL